MKYRIALNVAEDELVECASFCRENDLGVEVTAFAYPKNLDYGYEKNIVRHKKALEQIDFISLHGPFFDLFVTSPDPAIVEVCSKRHKAAMHAAAEIGATMYVAHLNSIPLINNETYLNIFVQKATEFWLPLADEAEKHNMTIVLENMWESSPYLQKQVVKQANHSCLKASFDNGHALVFSNKTAEHWIRELREDLVHCHLHDNDKKYDHHLPVGEGEEDWGKLIPALLEYSPKAIMVLESDLFPKNKQSLQNLRRMLKIHSAK